MPQEPGTARFACSLFVDGKPHSSCPRGNLERVLDHARRLGFVYNAGIEPEFFLVERAEDGTLAGWDPSGTDKLSKACYDYQSMSAAGPYLREMNEALETLGWGVYQLDHEDANYQYEINYRYAEALTTADRLIFFRMLAGDLARKRGAIATFMPKPFASRTGSGAALAFSSCRRLHWREPLHRRDRSQRTCNLSAWVSLPGRNLVARPSPVRRLFAHSQLL